LTYFCGGYLFGWPLKNATPPSPWRYTLEAADVQLVAVANICESGTAEQTKIGATPAGQFCCRSFPESKANQFSTPHPV
jgi:hypothetical protein